MKLWDFLCVEAALLVLLFFGFAAWAQTVPQTPPLNNEQLLQQQSAMLTKQIEALQEQNKFLDSVNRRLQADSEAREAELIKWLQEAQAAKPVPPKAENSKK